jgi:linoleoyl-CoA desaturase
MARLVFNIQQHPGFFAAVKARVDAGLGARGKTRIGDGTIWLKAAVYGTAAAGAYGLAVWGGLGGAWSLVLAVVYGMSALMFAINLAHDAAHNCLSPHRWVNRAVLTLCFTLLGVSGYLWQQRHVRSHHVFPNVNGCDIDIDENPLIRLSPNHPRKWFQRWQHLYAPVVYVLVSLHVIFVQDFIYLFKRELANMTDIRHPARQHAVFYACKAAYAVLVVIVPVVLSPFAWWQIAGAYLLMTFVTSLVFVYLLIGTHFCEEAEFPEVGPGGSLPDDWATHALATSADWSPESRIANFIIGGANAHAAHHLFPNVCHIHYPWIAREIAEVAREYGVRYNVLTLPMMIRSHFRLLRRLGGEPATGGLAGAAPAS